MNNSQTICINTLRKRSDFVAMRSGSRQHNPSFVLQSLVSTKSSANAIRVGFTVTKKVGNAVIRNRVKRRLRAAVQIVMPLDGKSGNDYVLIGKQAALHANFDTIVKQLRSSLNRVHKNTQTSPKKQTTSKIMDNQAGFQHGQ